MNALVYSCRGLGKSQTVHDLDALVCRYNPKVVFLSETMISKSRVKNLRWRLGLKYCLAVDSNGKRCGLALFWDEHLQVNLLEIGECFIDVQIMEEPGAEPWRATFVYGEPKVEDRHKMWEILMRIKDKSADPWLVVGDFNEAMWQFEHFSATRRGERQMENFLDMLDYCELMDVGFNGIPWTYDNKKPGDRNVKVRLDRAVATQEWMSRFFDAAVQHLSSPCSDHCPLLVNVIKE